MEGKIAHWLGKGGEVTADIVRNANRVLIARTNPVTGAGIPLYLLKGSPSFRIETPPQNLFD